MARTTTFVVGKLSRRGAQLVLSRYIGRTTPSQALRLLVLQARARSG